MKKKAPIKKERSVQMDTQPMKGKDKSCPCYSCPTGCGGWGLALLRLAVGVIFISQGWPKIFNSPMLLGLPGWIGSLVGIVEVLAGLALIIGIWVKWAGYLLALIMVVAIVFAKKFGWPSIQLDLVLLTAALTIAWCGPGRWSMHEKCGCCKH